MPLPAASEGAEAGRHPGWAAVPGVIPRRATVEESVTERPREDARLVLTIGHSTRTFAQFARLLREAGAERLVDVRRFPHSPRHPQFDTGSLAEELRGEGIGYTHLPGLGGRRRPRPDSPNAGWRNASFRGYADHMATEEFREDLQALLELCERERVCLMCSEAVWWRCHRRMISDALLIRGLPVEHILDERQRSAHVLTPWAKVVDEDGHGQLVYPPEGEPEHPGDEKVR